MSLPIHIGFTGTRYGMTDAQRRQVDITIAGIIGGDVTRNVHAHHGDCVGADAKFHEVARMYGCNMVGHLPIDSTHRAWCDFHEKRTPLPHMKRNAAIVAESDYMLATPWEAIEQGRGGTWATVRMARRAKKPLALILPDGQVAYERWPFPAL